MMLGWEYPPHITGGLGTACKGLTQALAQLGIKIDFVVPHIFGDEEARHMNLIEASRTITTSASTIKLPLLEEGGTHYYDIEADELPETTSPSPKISTFAVPAVLSPYWNEQTYLQHIEHIKQLSSEEIDKFLPAELFPEMHCRNATRQLNHKRTSGYGGDLFTEIELYARNVLKLVGRRRFDLIYAHDWITFPAAIALKNASKKPLIVHLHSLEADRSGASGNPRIRMLEARGIRAADKIIAVSQYTASMIAREYGINESEITVVHNGMDPKKPHRASNQLYREIKRNIVLFLGRITHQKGPGYFIEAAKRVLNELPDTTFVMAGSGDMLSAMITKTRELGILNNFKFTGFLKGTEVEEMYRASKLYVMPSVSEPFGLTALEAINYDVPVIVSKTSGVAEVLNHVMKTDYWDVKKLADMIISILKNEQLGKTIVAESQKDIKNLRWELSAKRINHIFDTLVKTYNS